MGSRMAWPRGCPPGLKGAITVHTVVIKSARQALLDGGSRYLNQRPNITLFHACVYVYKYLCVRLIIAQLVAGPDKSQGRETQLVAVAPQL